MNESQIEYEASIDAAFKSYEDDKYKAWMRECQDARRENREAKEATQND